MISVVSEVLTHLSGILFGQTRKAANKPKDGSSSHESKDDRRKADEESEGDASDDDGKSIDDPADAGGELEANPPETGGKPKGKSKGKGTAKLSKTRQISNHV
ncbi:hypothetical protein ACLOJK_002620 [Asimina triloba]